MSSLKESVSSWWSSISQREQRMLMVGAFLFALAAVYWGVMEPMTSRMEMAQARIANEKQLLQWVSNKADTITELRSKSGTAFSNQPFNQIISSSAKRHQIELIRIQPRDEMLQVWVKPVVFEKFINWLAYLQEKQGVQVEFMDIDRSETKGMVEVKRLQLKRG